MFSEAPLKKTEVEKEKYSTINNHSLGTSLCPQGKILCTSIKTYLFFFFNKGIKTLVNVYLVNARIINFTELS